MWIAAWMFTAFWLWSTQIFILRVAEPWLLATVIAAGVLLVYRDTPRGGEREGRRVWIGAAAAILAAALFPPVRLPALLAAAGLCLARFESDALRRVGATAVRSALALGAGGLALGLYWRYGPTLHDVPALSPVIRFFLDLWGADGAVVDGRVYIPDDGEVVRITPTVETLGLPSLFIFVCSGMALGAGRRFRLATIAWAAVGACAYSVFRLAFLYTWILSTDSPGLVRHPFAMMVFLLPLALLFRAFVRPAAQAGGIPRRGTVRIAGIGAAGAAALWLSFVLVDPGVRKNGVLMIDEHHSAWERTDVPMGTEEYGQKTTYTYYSLARFLDHYYDVRINYNRTITPELLEGVDVFVVKTPTEPYSASERAAIVDYVHQGGGLFLIGDHTDVFGTSTHLNPIAAAFDIRFEFDAQYNLDGGGLSLWERSPVYAHPAVVQLPPFLFATGCTLHGGPWVQPVQTGYGLMTLPGDYSQKSFFAERDVYHKDHAFGIFHQTLAATAGEGRVVAFSDSTVWSNFFMFVPGKPELALGLIHWLNHKNSISWMRPWLALIGVLLLIGARWLGGGGPSAWLWSAFVPSCLALGTLTPLMDAVSRDRYALPEPTRPYPSVGFVYGDSHFFVPMTQLIPPKGTSSFLTLFNWVQRVDRFPRAYRTVAEALRTSDCVVLVRRTKPLTRPQIEALMEGCRSGKSVFVLTDKDHAAAVEGLLAEAGFSIAARGDEEPKEAGALRTAAGTVLPESSSQWIASSLRVQGGEPLLADPKGRGIIGIRRFAGGGAMAVCGSAELFAVEATGHDNTVPTKAHLELYAVQYEIWNALVRGRVTSRIAAKQ